MTRIVQFIFACFMFSVLLSSCGSKDKSDNGNSLLQVARGDAAEIILVMDSAQWNGPLGTEMRRTFELIIPGLNREEPLFDLKQVAPKSLNGVLKSAKNMIFVTTLNNNTRAGKIMKGYYTAESLSKINEDPNLFYFTRKDNYARGQEILYLFGKDDESLIRKLRENGDILRQYFEEVENKRLQADLFKIQEKDLADVLYDRHNFKLKIPYGYELAQDKGNFVWLRALDLEVDKTIFVYYEPYTNQEVFKDITALRSRITEKYLRDIEKDDIYITYQDVLPFITKDINFKGSYAVETRGLWKTSDSTNGGPFISYTFVDEALNRLYYIEGYVYAPSKDRKRDFINEFQAILQSFQPAQSEASAAGR
ncbi:MAG: DUF4837 family protein [Imperialibacter sp.]|uniref:DUF4837 family protein n=1 Tax=Imperialibacter sp. TaxID=2038411 RepID=UPI0032EDEA5B